MKVVVVCPPIPMIPDMDRKVDILNRIVFIQLPILFCIQNFCTELNLLSSIQHLGLWNVKKA